ncbi:MAG TPA: DHA2 family efflux MFS transporter permease subunit [Solirubrobacteraceae bacterium]
MSAITLPAERRAGPRSGRRGHPWLTLVAVALGVMMVAVDGTVVSVANPTIGHDLGSSLAGLQWVTNAYLLSLAVLLIVGGKLGDRFGRRLIFSIGIAGFALASLGCALSGSIGMLIVFRVIQGVAGAMLMPNTLAILRATFPHDKLDQAVGIWGGSTALATASGPIVGGLLVQHVSWQSIFLINIPLGALALAVTLLVVAESRDPRAGRGLDPLGVGLLTGALFSIVWGLIKTQSHGWGSAYALGFMAAGFVLLALFVAAELRSDHPLLPMGLFANRSLSAGVVLVILGLFVLFGVLFFVTLYLQRVHGLSPVESGVRVLPLTGVFALSAPLGGVLSARFGPRVPLVIGMLLLGGAMLGLLGLQVDSGFSAMWPWFLAIGIALGLVVVASTQAIVGNAPVALGGVAGGLQTTANQLGGVLGTAVLVSIIVAKVGSTLGGHLAGAGVPPAVATHVTAAKQLVAQGIPPVSPHMSAALAHKITVASYASFMDALHAALLVGALCAFAGAALALLVRRGHGAATAAAV